MMDMLIKYRVWMRSKPDCYEQYSGKIDVSAIDEEAAIIRAYGELKQGAFPDRGPEMWNIDSVERLLQ